MTDDDLANLYRANRDRNERRDLLTTRPLTSDDIPATYERHMIVGDFHLRTYVHKEYNILSGKWDSHIRHVHDPKAIGAMERFMCDWQPTHLWYLGDVIDFPQFSTFEKEAEEEEGVDEDVQSVRAMFARHRSIVPNAVRVWTLGNHEERLNRHLRTHARAFRRVGALTFHEWFGLERERIAVFPYRVRVPILKGIFEVTHGDRVSQKSGYTANKMLDKNVSGVSGHVHRLGMIYRTTRTGTQVWAENGCLADLDPSYCSDPDWQNGFSIVWVDRANERFFMEQVPIIKGRAFYAGRTYEAAA